jgi:hypothetical protein
VSTADRRLTEENSLFNYTAYTRVCTNFGRAISTRQPAAFDAQGRAIGPWPYGTAPGDLFEYEASGSYRQHQIIVSRTAKVSRKLSACGYYVYGRATSDTDGPATLPSNPYDLRSEYGRAAYDNRRRGFVSATASLPLRLRMAPFLFCAIGAAPTT